LVGRLRPAKVGLCSCSELRITHHAAAGTKLTAIQRIVGQACLTTTQRYLHLVDRMMEDAMEQNAL